MLSPGIFVNFNIVKYMTGNIYAFFILLLAYKKCRFLDFDRNFYIIELNPS